MKFRVVAPVVAALLPFTGCAAFSDDTATPTDGITVAAAFYPLAYVAERVGGADVEVQNLTAPGGEPHDLELTTRETAEVARADLVVLEHGFQPAVDDAVATNATGDVLDVADVVDLQPGVAHDDHEHEDLDGVDPHFWHDPLLMADLGDAVAEHLADVDPDHAADYAANAASLREDLEALDTAYADGLADCERHDVVVAHDAFGYLTRFGLHFEPIAGLSPDAEPTPADLRDLQALIDEAGITTVFYESLVSPDIAEQLASDTGVGTAVLDPIEGLTDQTADEDYLSLMESNLAALREANGC